MNIDIQEIVNAKLKEMEEGKVLENLISSTVEKAVTNAVTDAIDGYSIRRILEDKIEKDVKAGVADIGFTAYNTLIVNKVRELMESIVKEDLATKVTGLFENVLINKRETIKLSEIIEEYHKLYEDMDYDDWRELEDGHFQVEWDEEEDGSFRRLNLTLSQEIQEKNETWGGTRYYRGSKEKKLEMHLSSYKDEAASIYMVKFEDKDLSDVSVLRNMSSFEALMMNLYLNKTKVEIDVEDDIDTYVEGYDD